MFGLNQQKPQEPEFVGIFYKLDEASGSLVALERQTGVAKVKVKAFGFGGGEGTIEIKGDRSPVRFKSGEKLEFVVKFAALQADPYSQIQLLALDSQKGKRSLMVTKVGVMAQSSKQVTDASAITFNIAKHGESSLKIIPERDLPPGEYTLSSASSNSAFCFGVDGPSGVVKK